MELVLAGESRPDTTDLNVKIIIKKKKVKWYARQPGSCVQTLLQKWQTCRILQRSWLKHLLAAL